MGEDFVVSMCHHIEDPTFDATAVATNPHARIRPIHRPPRHPVGREPHCHWTATIDPSVEPIIEHELTQRVRTSRLARVDPGIPPAAEPGGYYGPNGFYELKGPPRPAKIMPQAKDFASAAMLWDVSATLTGVSFDEIAAAA